jgi:hypothetical protein
MHTDAMSTSGMFLAGLIMVTRNRYVLPSCLRDSRIEETNRYLAWPALMFGISSYINYHPMRVKEGQPPIANLLYVLVPFYIRKVLTTRRLSFAALVASYVPLFLQTPQAPVVLTADT